MVSDKTIHKAFKTHEYKQNPKIWEFFYFHFLPKLYIGFNTKY